MGSSHAARMGIASRVGCRPATALVLCLLASPAHLARADPPPVLVVVEAPERRTPVQIRRALGALLDRPIAAAPSSGGADPDTVMIFVARDGSADIAVRVGERTEQRRVPSVAAIPEAVGEMLTRLAAPPERSRESLAGLAEWHAPVHSVSTDNLLPWPDGVAERSPERRPRRRRASVERADGLAPPPLGSTGQNR